MNCTPVDLTTPVRLMADLFQSGAPDIDDDLTDYALVVLAAREYQPALKKAHSVHRVPLEDIAWRQVTPKEADAVEKASNLVSMHLLQSHPVLVTCSAGLNRSSLIAARALCKAYRLTPPIAVDTIRVARGPFALSNAAYLRYLLSVG